LDVVIVRNLSMMNRFRETGRIHPYCSKFTDKMIKPQSSFGTKNHKKHLFGEKSKKYHYNLSLFKYFKLIA
tara:strand:- start:48450 stop:48662 length:213 start_codon:yes stop_codon:yes gene_type:complete